MRNDNLDILMFVIKFFMSQRLNDQGDNWKNTCFMCGHLLFLKPFKQQQEMLIYIIYTSVYTL